ncbi:hypothetical protein BHE74_00053830 [Ensete ventricosum]|nr:hypothetical protein BHE74_00053830 [Ensete ventricosum]RZR99941.1 hypothetical protein BHM03_00029571 [Ensete ventricosum]
MARPFTGAASHGLATHKGDDDARKGRQMLATCRRPPVGVATHKGDTYGQKRCPQGLSPIASRGTARPRPAHRGVAPVELSPVGAELAVGATTDWQGSRRPRRGDDGGSIEGAKGLGHSF